MSLTTAILTELPLRSSLPFTFSPPKSSIILFLPFSSLCLSAQPSHSQNIGRRPNPSFFPHRSLSNYPAPWISKWPSLSPPSASNRGDIAKTSEKRAEERVGTRQFDKDRGSSAIDRIVLRLRNLGLGSDDEEEEEELGGESAMPVTGDEKLGDLLQRDWVRPDKMLIEDEGEEDIVLPWEKEEGRGGVEKDEERGKNKRRVANAPTLAELTIEDEELRRLRRAGMTLREKINVPKAGMTQAVLDKIHDKWRKEELVRLKFHEALAHDMKTGHEIVEVGGFDELYFATNDL